MSLKAFHIVFIAISVLLCFGTAAWLAIPNSHETTPLTIAGSILSFLGGIGLLVYGKRFLRKFKHVSYL
jgi:hypothetical protein